MGRVAVAWGAAATGRGPDPVPVGWAPVVAALRERVPGPAATEAPGVATPWGVWSSNDPFSSVSFQGSRPRAYGAVPGALGAGAGLLHVALRGLHLLAGRH